MALPLYTFQIQSKGPFVITLSTLTRNTKDGLQNCSADVVMRKTPTDVKTDKASQKRRGGVSGGERERTRTEEEEERRTRRGGRIKASVKA